MNPYCIPQPYIVPGHPSVSVPLAGQYVNRQFDFQRFPNIMSQGQFLPSTPPTLPAINDSQNSPSKNQISTTSAAPMPSVPLTFYNYPDSVPLDKLPAPAVAPISLSPPYYNVLNELPQVPLPAQSPNSLILNSFLQILRPLISNQ